MIAHNTVTYTGIEPNALDNEHAYRLVVT